MRPGDEAPLIEEVAGAFRPRDPRALAFLPAWHDLSPEGREEAFELSLQMREMEAALDPEGYSSTVRAVLVRIFEVPRVHDGRIVETAHHVRDRVDFPDVLQELVAKPLSLRRTRDESGDVDELHDIRDRLWWLHDLGQLLQAEVGDLYHAHVRVDGAERIILGRDGDGRERLEQRRLADIGKTHDSDREL